MRKKEAKLSLYKSLFKVPFLELTDNEIDIMFMLAKDGEVQAHLEERRKYNEHHQ